MPTLETRRAELPPRDTPVFVVAGAAERRSRSARARAGWATHVSWLAAPPGSMPHGLADRGPAVRLWRPAPFLTQVLPALGTGRALDLAAGSGREAVTLALNGFAVEAWDRAPEALARCADLAARNGVSVATVVCDLEWRELSLPESRWNVITVFRFLHLPLFPAIARALAPGGRLVYETYREGQERWGRPTHGRFLLRAGELSSAFPTLTVEHYEECAPEGGPVTARLLARRPD
jgi:SAM-dependent methyltransferase